MLGPHKSTTLGPCETARTSSTERRCPEAPGQMKRKRRTRRRAAECTAERGISSSKIGGELKQKIGEKQETCGCFWMILVNGIDLKKEIQREKLRAYGRLRELQGAKFCRLEVPESSNLGLSDFSLTIPFG